MLLIHWHILSTSFLVKQRSPIAEGRNRSFQRLISSATRDTIDMGVPQVERYEALSPRAAIERTRHKVEGYELHELGVVRLEDGATKPCGLDILGRASQ